MGKFVVSILLSALVCSWMVQAEDNNVDQKSKALAHYIVAITHDLNSQTDQALAEYERAAALNPTEPLPHLRLAAYYSRVGKLNLAIKELKKVLDIDPSNAKAHYILALVYSGQKKYDLASREYEKILKGASDDDPQNVEIYSYLAQLYFSQGKYQEAVNQFEKIIAFAPDNVDALFSMASAQFELKRPQEAIGYYKKILKLDATHDQALNALAYVYAQENTRLDDALRLAQKAISLDPSNGAYYDTFGWVLFKKGSFEQSLMALHKASDHVQDPVIFDHIGDVYMAKGEGAQAWNYWKKSLDLNPQQPAVLAKVQQLEKTQVRKR